MYHYISFVGRKNRPAVLGENFTWKSLINQKIPFFHLPPLKCHLGRVKQLSYSKVVPEGTYQKALNYVLSSPMF